MNQTNTNISKEFFLKAKNEVVIDVVRKELLTDLVNLILGEISKDNRVNLNFICTHNSRRSQLAQVWSHFAIHHFKLENIESFSGGTEVTAMHRNTVKTLQSVGFNFNVLKFSHENPVYEISFGATDHLIKTFSKLYNDAENKSPFIAITTCSSADENCPFIPEAVARLHVPYIDPKIADNTPEMESKYLATNKEIAAEMFFVFNEVKKCFN